MRKKRVEKKKRVKKRDSTWEMLYYEDNPLLGEEKGLNVFKMSPRKANQQTKEQKSSRIPAEYPSYS